MILTFLTGPFLVWLPKIFYAAVFCAAALLFYKKSYRHVKWLITVVIFFRVFYVVLTASLQYYVWLSDARGKFLLPPYQPLSYFFGYSWTRFGFNAALSIGAALFFYLLLKIIEKIRPACFEQGKNEPEFCFLSALIVGWPGFVLFVPLALAFLLIDSIINSIITKKFCLCLALACLLAVPIVLIFQDKLLGIFKLGVLRI